MSKIKKWLKIKLKKFLEIETIETNIENTKSEMLKHNEQTDFKFTGIKKQINTLDKNISNCQESIKVLHNTLQNVVNIGTNYVEVNRHNNHSWAVVCIEGKINIVKFIDLDGQNAREILGFLKNFEAGRHCIDTPRKFMFYDNLYKF